MKVSLLEQKFDLDKLLYKINMFEMIEDKYPNYVVMSERTVDAIENQYGVYYVEKNIYFKHNKRYIGEIFGIPIAYNDNLQFGTVDIV